MKINFPYSKLINSLVISREIENIIEELLDNKINIVSSNSSENKISSQFTLTSVDDLYLARFENDQLYFYMTDDDNIHYYCLADNFDMNFILNTTSFDATESSSFDAAYSKQYKYHNGINNLFELYTILIKKCLKSNELLTSILTGYGQSFPSAEILKDIFISKRNLIYRKTGNVDVIMGDVSDILISILNTDPKFKEIYKKLKFVSTFTNKLIFV